MTIHTEQHPLDAWLERKGIRAWRFADEAAISRAVIYKVISGREPSLSTLIKIEKATGSEVTMRMCAEYLERKKELEND